MGHLREVFAIQAKAMRGVPPSAQHWALLDEAWSEMLKNRPQTKEDPVWPPARKEAGEDIFVCTDASETAWSWVELREGKCVRLADGSNPHGSFPPHENKMAIFYKELFATRETLRALAKAGHTNCNVTIVGDNRAVIGAINKMMGPEEAWPMLDEIRELVERNAWSPVMKWVESAGNVAHSWTHEEKIEIDREARTWLIAKSEVYVPPTVEDSRAPPGAVQIVST